MPGRRARSCAVRRRPAQVEQGRAKFAQGETNVLDEISGELAHEGGVRPQERSPRLESALIGDGLGDESIEAGRDVGPGGLLHAQSVYANVLAVATI